MKHSKNKVCLTFLTNNESTERERKIDCSRVNLTKTFTSNTIIIQQRNDKHELSCYDQRRVKLMVESGGGRQGDDLGEL